MREKITITQEQADFIEGFKEIMGMLSDWESRLIAKHSEEWSQTYLESTEETKNIKDLTPFELSRALIEGYEIKKEFKVGDWIVKKNGDKFFTGNKVECLTDVSADIVTYGSSESFEGVSKIKESVRHATKEEIEEEKENRKWSSIERRVGEFKEGDKIVNHHGSSFTIYSTTGAESAERMYKEGQIKGFYPSESYISLSMEEEE